MTNSTASSNAVEVTSPEHFQSLLSQDLQRISLINFWAPWAVPCAQMNEVALEIARKYPQLLLLQVRCVRTSEFAVDTYDLHGIGRR